MIATAYYQEGSSLYGSTLSEPQWVEPPFSTSQDELDQSNHIWRVQREKKLSAEQKFRIGIESRPPSWLSHAVSSLNLLLALTDNWDSYGAQSIKTEAAIAAIQVLHSVMEEKTPLPSIVPTPLGNIQLEWHKFGIDLEVEVTPSQYYSISYEDETKGTEPYEDDSANRSVQNLQPLLTFINQITERANMEG